MIFFQASTLPLWNSSLLTTIEYIGVIFFDAPEGAAGADGAAVGAGARAVDDAAAEEYAGSDDTAGVAASAAAMRFAFAVRGPAFLPRRAAAGASAATGAGLRNTNVPLVSAGGVFAFPPSMSEMSSPMAVSYFLSPLVHTM